MKYKDEVPKPKQIRLDQFRLLPGDIIRLRCADDYYNGVVREVWSANPEYVLGGPKAKDAGVVKWTEKERAECEAFLRGGHKPVKIRLKKSMWARVELYLPTGSGWMNLYTYDIEERHKKGELIIQQKTRS